MFTKLFYYSQFLNSSGLIIKPQTGRRWIIKSCLFFELIDDKGLVKFLIWPCCVVEYMWREYAAVRNLVNEIMIIIHMDLEIIVTINMISLSKLIDGGAAIFVMVNINHQRVIMGLIVINPFVRNILRVWVFSYDIFARAKRADEHNPWAIIIMRAPDIPHDVLESIPASIKPICPTEEYAISDLRSGCRIHRNLVAMAPVIESLISKGDI